MRRHNSTFQTMACSSSHTLKRKGPDAEAPDKRPCLTHGATLPTHTNWCEFNCEAPGTIVTWDSEDETDGTALFEGEPGGQNLSPVSRTNIAVTGTDTVMEPIFSNYYSDDEGRFRLMEEIWACNPQREESTFRYTDSALVAYSRKLLEGRWGNASDALYFHKDLWDWCSEGTQKTIRSLGAKIIHTNTRSLKEGDF